MSWDQSKQPDKVNWECPVDMCEEVFDNPMIALRHIYYSQDQGHGKGQALLEDNWPQPTEKDPTVENMGDEFEEWLLRELDIGEDLYQDIVQTHDLEFPPVLQEYEKENFRVLSAANELEHDLRRIEKMMKKADFALKLVLQKGITFEEATEEVEESEDFEEETLEIEDSQSGAGMYTREDVMEAEEKEVFAFLERAGVLDDQDEEAKDAFEYVYRQRDAEEVKIDEVADELNCPPKNAAEILDMLEERNLIEADPQTDTFYYPY